MLCCHAVFTQPVKHKHVDNSGGDGVVLELINARQNCDDILLASMFLYGNIVHLCLCELELILVQAHVPLCPHLVRCY